MLKNKTGKLKKRMKQHERRCRGLLTALIMQAQDSARAYIDKCSVCTEQFS